MNRTLVAVFGIVSSLASGLSAQIVVQATTQSELVTAVGDQVVGVPIGTDVSNGIVQEVAPQTPLGGMARFEFAHDGGGLSTLPLTLTVREQLAGGVAGTTPVASTIAQQLQIAITSTVVIPVRVTIQCSTASGNPTCTSYASRVEFANHRDAVAQFCLLPHPDPSQCVGQTWTHDAVLDDEGLQFTTVGAGSAGGALLQCALTGIGTDWSIRIDATTDCVFESRDLPCGTTLTGTVGAGLLGMTIEDESEPDYALVFIGEGHGEWPTQFGCDLYVPYFTIVPFPIDGTSGTVTFPTPITPAILWFQGGTVNISTATVHLSNALRLVCP